MLLRRTLNWIYSWIWGRIKLAFILILEMQALFEHDLLDTPASKLKDYTSIYFRPNSVRYPMARCKNDPIIYRLIWLLEVTYVT
jgi:hypothetical protein